jgi:hypothetical protein
MHERDSAMMTAAIDEVVAIHAVRRNGDTGERYCLEDRQLWPCATIVALRCQGADGGLGCALIANHLPPHHG